ncbi:MAG: 4-(cytidine 5'-diphospho)-2-C-methyl-D-erythritol kinase [Opitutae bacterium]|jgi:4-diphosphocytidyl-2-C-methyl-D-erythritol kinase|nr:4-(cytidine 5'-diphospho)-2-C-methyl-D-erythritol kinase [Opitutae bacterium]MBT5716818.1 4-(cytidine 5'-diphospho)-2-C-methyl-D-erythritol kinase [Opitutae bacterium]
MNVKNAIDRVSLPAPAKINLFLAITGKRTDGYHEINSVLSTIQLSDQITLLKTGKRDDISCICEEDNTLSGPDNLVCRAIDEWRKFTGDRTGVKVIITKRIPKMAGLGGGSSDAVATLLALNIINGKPLEQSALLALAEKLGSDCPFFLLNGLGHAQGRGEQVIDITGERKKELDGQRIFLFQPPMGFSTPLLYRELAKESLYCDSKWAENNVGKWESGMIPVDKLFYNDFGNVILKKYLFLKPLFKELNKCFGLQFNVSGSGSCCFSFATEDVSESQVRNLIIRSLGQNSQFWVSRICYG